MTEEPDTNVNEFELALRESLEARAVKPGDVIQGTIVAIHGDVALVDVSGKSEAVLDRTELDELGTGDPVEVVVVSTGEEIRVSRRMAIEAKLKEKLLEAVASGEPVEGKVAGRRKGGFDITVAGVRGFCPISHISDVRSEDVDEHLGKSYTFKVLEYDGETGRLVVSRAAHLREEKERLSAAAWARLEVGAEVEGRVRSLTDFGAFVDLGGVDGLVHVTEIAHHRVHHPRDVLRVDETVRVKVLDLDRAKDRISLSIKALQADPWESVEDKFPAGGPFEGTIVRATDFGLFVELEPGLDGLLHVSQLPPGMEKSSPELQVGQQIRGWVREVDTDNRRIGLTLRQVPEHDPWERVAMRYQEGQVIDGTVENGTDFGVFVELEPGLSGLIPISELALEKDVDPRDAFAPGEKVQAKLLSLDPGRRRISLSVKALERDRERQEYRKHMDSEQAAEPTLTGFGAQLAAALDKGEKEAAAAAEKEGATKKTTAKKSAAKKSPAKKKTATEKKAPAKKTAAKKATAKKSTTTKAASKKPTAKKAAPKKTTAKQSASEKSSDE
jgi:small subunit ribosomal protein S1